MQKIASPVAGCMRWGKWGAQYSTKQYRTMIDACLQHGINTFDNADIYGDYNTEEEFGNAMKEDLSLRDRIQLITKCGIQMMTANRPHHQIKSYNTSKEHIIHSAETSLKHFGTSYLDVLLIHRPDPLMHPHEIAEAVFHLKKQGKILQFGVSNFLPHHVNALRRFVEIDYNQVEISIIHTAPFLNGVLDNCLEHHIIPMAWAPLGGGLFNDDSSPHFRRIVSSANELAEKYSTGINQILVAFLLKHPSKIIPVIGTTKVERLLQAKEANTIFLSREDWFKLWTAVIGEDIP